MKRLFAFAAIFLSYARPAWCQEATKTEAGQFAVLRSDRLAVPVELGSNASQYCSIVGTGSSATMQCHSSSRMLKTYYRYNTALLLDSRGMAYVIACRWTLFSTWCKPLTADAHFVFPCGPILLRPLYFRYHS
jgi:hypothetical protein